MGDRSGEVTLIGHEPLYQLGLVTALEQAGFSVRCLGSPPPGGRVPGAAVLSLRSSSGIDLLQRCEALRALHTIVLVDDLYPDVIRAMLRTRIHGVAIRSSTPEQIVQVLRSAREGIMVVTPSIVERLAASPPVTTTSAVHLTHEQLRLLRLIASGRGMQDVASQLAYSQRTLYRRQRELLARLGARSRTEALREAGRLGLLEDEQPRDQ